MPDNVGYTPGSGSLVAADEVSYSGDTSLVQLQRLVHVTGAEGSRTVQSMVVTTTDPGPDDAALIVAPRPQDTWVCSFARSGSGLLTDDLVQRRLGTGVGVSQSGGNLVLTTGTTANSEFLARSTVAFQGAWIARAQVQLSQRIANQNFAVLLADLVGEGLTCTINSATSITVAIPGHTFTSENVGQFLFVGAITGANGVPGRYAIASVVAGTSITLTVAGWPASGSCTVDVFGWNWVRTLYTGTVATNAAADAQRRGWNSSDTTLTVQSTAAPGHIVQMAADGRAVYWSDTLAASAATPALTTRGSRFANMPDQDVQLFVFLWLFNGTAAPASTTTWTVGFVSVEDTVNLPVYLAGNRAQSMPMPVTFLAAQPVSGTVTANIGTGSIAAGTNAIGDVGMQYRANATGAGSLANINCPATPVAQSIKGSAGRLITLSLTNTGASTRWLKLWNTLNTGVTLGTTAAIAEIALPVNQNVYVQVEGGIGFATAITCAITGGAGLTNNTAVTAGDVTGFVVFA
jgi:hypothetical protein